MSPRTITFDPATAADSACLSILADMATRRLTSYLWDSAAKAGQSPFELGRAAIRNHPASTVHYSNWQVARAPDGTVLGGMNGYLLRPAAITAPTEVTAPVLEPLNALKTMALGTFYIAAIATFPEARGHRIARALLQRAETLAQEAGAAQVSLMVGSFNPAAQRLYHRLGYIQQAERAFVPFPGSDRSGRWVLMTKPVTEETA